MNFISTFKQSKKQRREQIMLQIHETFGKYKFNREKHVRDPLPGFAWGQYFLNFDMSFCIKVGVHYILYMDSLENLGTDKHLPLIERAVTLNDFGCFALTELGHGSNVAQLGTTAHFIKESREFVINTPDSLSAKWWIGGAAQTSTNTILFAQLYVEGVNHGLHAFAIKIREEGTFKTKPGVIIGDCGKKFQHDGIDNGFMIFKDFRVPYDSMLDKISQINSEGRFVSTISKKEKRLGIMLSTLIRGRTAVIAGSEGNLKNALTIAIRWASIRKQFGPQNSPEVPILDYPLTRIRIIPHLANLFAISAGAEIIYTTFSEVKKKTAIQPDCFESTEFHAVLSAVKVVTSEWAFQGIHESRRLCGGMGYSSLNRLGELLAQQDVNLTWEGDNHILIQQAAGFVVKQSMKFMQGVKIQGYSLKNIEINLEENTSKRWNGSPEDLHDLHRALVELLNVVTTKSLRILQKASGKYEKYVDVWNNSQCVLQELGRIYGIVQIAIQWQNHLESLRIKCVETYEIVSGLFKVYCIDKLRKYKAELIATRYFDGKNVENLEKYFEKLCLGIGESCVNIIDAIANDDSMVDSCIGLKDGQAYSRLGETIEAQADCYGMQPWLEDIKKLKS